MANEPRVRRDVQSLIAEGPSGLKVLEDYATAIAAMKALDADEDVDPADPRSWRFQAAIHGFAGVRATIDDPNHWSSCRHFSWFFLAWHRVYLFYFERMIQFHLQDDTWSLPYWDYTKRIPGDDSCRILPEPFRTPRTNNELFTPLRDPDVNDETNPEAAGRHPLRRARGAADRHVRLRHRQPGAELRRRHRRGHRPERGAVRLAGGDPARLGPRARRRRPRWADVRLQHRRPGSGLLDAPQQPRPPVGRLDREVGRRRAAARRRLARHGVQVLRLRRDREGQADQGYPRQLRPRIRI